MVLNNWKILFLFAVLWNCPSTSAYVFSRDPNYSRWPNRIVPYIFNPGDYSSTDQSLIQSAMAQITNDLGGCVVWQNLGSTASSYPFINFVIISRTGGPGIPAPVCYSYPGMISFQRGLGQHMSVQSGINGCMTNVRGVMRLLSYLLGLRPEHNKPNRNTYIATNTGAVSSVALNAGVFNILSNPVTNSYNANEFDYNSITMLDPLTYSATGSPVITSITGTPIHNTGRLSVRDCQTLAFLYNCTVACQDVYGSGPLPIQFTTTSSSTGGSTVSSGLISTTTTAPLSAICDTSFFVDAAWNDLAARRLYLVSGSLVYIVQNQNGLIVSEGASLTTLFPGGLTPPLTAGYYAQGVTYLVDMIGNTFLYQNGAFLSQTQGSPNGLTAASGFGITTANQANPLNIVSVFVDNNNNIFSTGINPSTPVQLSAVFAGNPNLVSDINLFGIEEMFDFVDAAGVEKLAFLYQPTDGRPLQYFEGTPCNATSLLNAQNQICLTASSVRAFSKVIVACGPAAALTRDSYAIIIDGGSSHTDLFVYKWSNNKINGTGVVVQQNFTGCNTVLSSFLTHPQDAGPSLRGCLNIARQIIPETEWNNTKLILGATAGMRIADTTNHTATLAIFQSIQTFIAQNYQFKAAASDIGILTPENEGGYAWLSINYVKGFLRTNSNLSAASRLPTWGSLDLGGASTQFSVEVTSTVNTGLTPTFTATVFGQTYRVFTRSFLCFGNNEALRRYKAQLIVNQNFADAINDPCQPAGATTTVRYSDSFEQVCSNRSAAAQFKKDYAFIGSGNDQNCLTAVRQLFRETLDLNPSTCPFNDAQCSFANIQPGTIQGKFLATSALFFDARDVQTLNSGSFSINPLDVQAYHAARDAMCRRTNAEIQQLITSFPAVRSSFIPLLCYYLTYDEVLLSDVYKFTDQGLRENVTFAANIDGVDLGWALGAALVTSNAN